MFIERIVVVASNPLRVAIEYEEPGNSIVGEGLAQLLRNPDARRMTRDMAVQDAATIVADDEESVEHAERKSWEGEGIHGGDGFAVIAQESQPTFGWPGLLGARLIQRETVIPDISKPSMKSSPRMRGAPQLGFSATV